MAAKHPEVNGSDSYVSAYIAIRRCALDVLGVDSRSCRISHDLLTTWQASGIQKITSGATGPRVFERIMDFHPPREPPSKTSKKL